MTSKRSTIHLRIIAPTSIVFEGDVDSVSAANQVGPFDVLPGHANLFTLLTGGPVVIRQNSDRQVLSVQKGIMKVQDDRVTVYANVGIE